MNQSIVLNDTVNNELNDSQQKVLKNKITFDGKTMIYPQNSNENTPQHNYNTRFATKKGFIGNVSNSNMEGMQYSHICFYVCIYIFFIIKIHQCKLIQV